MGTSSTPPPPHFMVLARIGGWVRGPIFILFIFLLFRSRSNAEPIFSAELMKEKVIIFALIVNGTSLRSRENSKLLQ